MLVLGLGLGGCKLFDEVGWMRDPETGACPAELPGGAAAGEPCESAEDCAAVCCGCSDGLMPDFAAVACLDKVCADEAAACAAVEENQEEACALLVDYTQTDAGECPEALSEGAAEDEECASALDCAATCCLCEDGVTGYEARACDDDECEDAEDACEAALDADPSLCPDD